QGMVHPGYELRHVAMSTSPYTPFLVINGPIVQRLGINSGMACLGPGAPSSANIAIGRAIRLIMMNIGGNYVSVTDIDTNGDSNKFSMCLAEREEENPWEPLHVERGFKKEDSTVTVFVSYASIPHADHKNNEAVPFLKGLATTVSLPGASPTTKWVGRPKKNINSFELKPDDYHEDCVIVLCPNHARMLARDGFSKVGVKEVLHSFARLPIGVGIGMPTGAINRYKSGESEKPRPDWSWLHNYPDFELPVYRTPECYQVIVAGADSQKSMVVLGGKQTRTIK